MAYQQDDRKWINRLLLHYSDKVYQTEGTLSIDITSFTSDDKVFSIPKMYFRLRNLDGKNRSFSLDLDGVIDLLTSLKLAGIQNQDLFCKRGENNKIIKKGYNISLSIFGTVAQDESQVVILELIINDSDRGRIALPYNSFKPICNILEMFKKDFWTIFTDIQRDYQIPIQNNLLKSIETKLTILPTLINNIENQTQVVNSENFKEETETEQLIEDYDKFIEEKLDSPEVAVNIPEIEHGQKELENGISNEVVEQEIYSKFFEVALSNDIVNFEQIINSIHSTPGCTLINFIQSIKVSMEMNESFSFLPNITDDDMKALALSSQVMFKTELQGWLQKNIPISSSFGILRYNIDGVTEIDNIELAYDLLTIMVYIHRIRERLESRSADAQSNKSILYAAIRCFLDPLIFSFIIDKPAEIIKSAILSRYKQYKQKGFFKSFDDLIVDKVTDIEILDFIDKVSTAESQSIDKLYENAYKKKYYEIPYKNDLTLEQIVKENVDLHVQKRLNMTEEKLQNNKSQKVQHKKNPIRYNSNIHRVLNKVDFKTQVPESFREPFLEYISSLEKNDYNYSKFSIEELGDEVVKALYIWNESEKQESYSTFRSQLEQCMMTKNMIITKIKSGANIEDTVGGVDENFDFTSLNLE